MAEVNTNVIVAIPSQDDPVWQVSSEKIPHITILYLADLADDFDRVLEFVAHACETFYRFGLTVDYRGTLGSDDADVLFFEKNGWDLRQVNSFRNSLMLNKDIRKAYNMVEQFPEWTPHLTLGYPTSPAKETTPPLSLGYVTFDRIAIWNGESIGPEINLGSDDRWRLEMADYASNILVHHGVKGMKWGVRRDRINTALVDAKASVNKELVDRTGKKVVVRTKAGEGVRTVGGNKRPAHADAVSARTSEQIAKRSTLDALSNVELQKLVTRMNLEQQYRNLSSNETRDTAAEKYINKFLNDNGNIAAKKLGPAYPVISKIAEEKLGLTNKAAASGKSNNKQK